MKHLRTSILLTVWFVAVTGLAFPLTIYGIGRMFPKQADGSMIRDAKGNVIGSELIGQSFTKPEYFHPRPSAAGSGYDPTASGGTNLGQTRDKLINGLHKKTADGKDDPSNFDGVKDLALAYRAENGLAAEASVPSDAVTRSGSGLDPDISVKNASLQSLRVANARHIPVAAVRQLVKSLTSDRFLEIFGEPSVNVLKLNLALDAQKR